MSELDDRRSFIEAVSSLVSALIILFLLTPTAFYARNVNEFPFSPSEFLPLLLAAAGLLAALGASLLFTFKSARSPTFWFLTFAGWMMWLQANVLDLQHGNIEERIAEEQAYLGLIDLAVATGLVVAAWRLGRVRVHALNRFLLLFLVLALSWEVVQAQKASTNSQRTLEYAADPYPKFDFSKDHNIIMLLLDETQSNTFEKMVLRDPEFAPHFEDFTLFRDTISNTHATDHSVPMILTGEFYDNSIPYNEVVQRYQTSSLPLELRRSGYRTDLYFHTPSTTYYHPDFASNSRATRTNPIASAARLMDASLLMVSSHFLKSWVYNRGEWRLSQNENWLERTSESLFHSGDDRPNLRPVAPLEDGFGDQDTLFIRELQVNGRVEAQSPTFKFYHLKGSHVPFDLDSAGRHIKRSFDHYELKMQYKARLLVQAFSELKKLGIYEDATIVILSDHGSGRSDRNRVFRHPKTGSSAKLPKALARSNAIMLIKHGKELAPATHDKPFQLKQLPDLIAHLVAGRSLNSFIEAMPERSVRRYFGYHWKDVHPFIQKRYQEYIVVDAVWAQGAFIPYHQHPAEYLPGHCLFDRTDIERTGEYLGTLPTQRSSPERQRFTLPQMTTKLEDRQERGYWLVGALSNGSLAEGSVTLDLMHDGRLLERVEVLSTNPVFEFDLTSTSADFSQPYVLQAKTVIEVEELHVFSVRVPRRAHAGGSSREAEMRSWIPASGFSKSNPKSAGSSPITAAATMWKT